MSEGGVLVGGVLGPPPDPPVEQDHDVPPGGTLAQVLTKLSNVDYDYNWLDPAGGGGGGPPAAHAVSHAPGGTDPVDGSYATDADLANHVAAADPHTVYALDTDLTAHAGLPNVHHAQIHASAHQGGGSDPISGLAIPTGTGFRHVTGGAEDAASKLVANADVDSAAAVALSKLANINTARLLGRTTASAGAIEELTAGNGLTLAAGALSAIAADAQTADVTAAETTTSATYTNLTTTGPSLPAVTIGPSGKALVLLSVQAGSSALAGVAMAALSVDGATPVDVDGAGAFSAQSATNTRTDTQTKIVLVAGLSAGSHSFLVQYRSDGVNTGRFVNRRLVVVPL